MTSNCSRSGTPTLTPAPDSRSTPPMQVVITAVGPDNRGLADPIVHSVTGMGANIAEIQMYDHDEESVFSMLTRIEHRPARVRRTAGGDDRSVAADEAFDSHVDAGNRGPPAAAGDLRDLSARSRRWRSAARDSRWPSKGRSARSMIGNRDTCRGLAEQFDVPWFNIDDRQNWQGRRHAGRRANDRPLR